MLTKTVFATVACLFCSVMLWLLQCMAFHFITSIVISPTFAMTHLFICIGYLTILRTLLASYHLCYAFMQLNVVHMLCLCTAACLMYYFPFAYTTEFVLFLCFFLHAVSAYLLISIVSILLPRCWRQQIGRSYCAASRTFSPSHDAIQRKRSLCQEHAVLLMV